MTKFFTIIFIIGVAASTHGQLIERNPDTKAYSLRQVVEDKSFSKQYYFDRTNEFLLKTFGKENIISSDLESSKIIGIGSFKQDGWETMEALKSQYNTYNYNFQFDFKEGKFRYTFDNFKMIQKYSALTKGDLNFDFTKAKMNKKQTKHYQHYFNKLIMDLKKYIATYNYDQDDW